MYGVNIFLKTFAPIDVYNYINDSEPPADYIEFLINQKFTMYCMKKPFFVECDYRVREQLSVDINQRTVKSLLEELL